MKYAIGKFSEMIGLSIHTLRYYEKENLIVPAREDNGRRSYSESDLTWIQFIQRLKDTDMPIKKIKEYAELRAIGDSTMVQRREILQQHKKKLERAMAKFQEHLNNLNSKIEYYDDEIQKQNPETQVANI